jgi:uncharacterized protein (TIGR03067 family)
MASEPVSPEPGSDPKKLQGAWKMTRWEIAGEVQPPVSAGTRTEVVLSFTGERFGRMTYYRSSKIDALPERHTGKFKPVSGVYRAIDFNGSDGGVRRGIFEIKGDTLRICTAPAGEKARPTKFETKGTKNTLRVFTRRP